MFIPPKNILFSSIALTGFMQVWYTVTCSNIKTSMKVQEKKQQHKILNEWVMLNILKSL